MNKKLIALAVASAFVAPVAMADTSNVTISGQMHFSLDSLKGKNAAGTDLTNQWNVSTNASFIQFAGTEDLGNGTSAVWKLKTYISAGGTGNSGDPYNLSASDGFTNGPAYLGMSGKTWGTVLLGKNEAPMKVLGRKVDLFGNQIGDIRNLGLGFDNRPNNAIQYTSPSLSGFVLDAMYSTNLITAAKTATTDKSETMWSGTGIYTNGPILVGLGYEKHNLSRLGTGLQDEKDWRLDGGYNFGAFKVVAMYEKVTDKSGASGVHQHVWDLGGAYKMGNNTIKAQYAKISDLGSTSNTGANMWALGLDHMMSKRTTVYAAYARTNNDTAASYSAFGAGHGDNPGTVAGKDPSGFSFGMIHNF